MGGGESCFRTILLFISLFEHKFPARYRVRYKVEWKTRVNMGWGVCRRNCYSTYIFRFVTQSDLRNCGSTRNIRRKEGASEPI